MTSQSIPSAHILFIAAPAWGHNRPLCAFASKIVKERQDVVITILTAGNYGHRIEQELSRYFTTGDDKLRESIRIANLGGIDLDAFALIPIIAKEFGPCYEKLLNCEPIQCLSTGRTFDGVCKPTAAIVDFFFLITMQAIRSISGKSVPVFAWNTGNASAFLRITGPENLGGLGNVTEKSRALSKETGRQVEQIFDELYHPSNGTVVNVPGLPPMYDYEWIPQEVSPEIPQNELFTAAYTFARECDGVICTTSSAYESESVDAVRKWFRETNRKVFVIGPLMPPGAGYGGLTDIAKEKEVDSLKNGHQLEDFLDNTLNTHGSNSLLYISFGSIWWPKNEYVWVLVDVLLELGFPFILSHPSPKAVIPPGYAEKVEKSGIGILSTWCPQQTILNHPATGWFLTHCGQNGVVEALTQGIPMIAWPLDADQPANAAHLTLNLDVAFELIEVRRALGLKPLYRGARPVGTIEAVAAEARSVLERTRGPEGKRKRRNAESMRGKLRVPWEEGGEAITELRKFLAEVSTQS